jgi:WD40 repeat protein
MDSEAQPFVGPRPFKREDAPFFFGRDREGNELLSLIISHAEVLLYAQSGAGKTSLINAKLWNLLEDEDLEVLPVTRVQGPPTSALPRSKIKNIYVFNALVRWLPPTTEIKEVGEKSLREVLEQREHALDQDGLPKPFVAIFDQFEELFTAYPECWEQRRDFFQQLREALDALPRMRVLFAMREDYLGGMEPYAAIMPEKLRVRFHLENLRKQQAIEAIENPLTRGPRKRRFASGVAERLAEELMKVEVEAPGGHTESVIGEFVEPVQLQVVCERLWRDLKPEDTEITLAHLETISVEKALLSFYEESIQTVADKTAIAEQTLRSWFEKKMITPAGTRGIAFRGETETEGLPNEAVDALDKLHLIRSELRGGGKQWYELMHDRFIDAIQTSRQRLVLGLEAGADDKRKQLEDKAAKWVTQGRKKSGLLADDELEEAQRWLASPAASALGTSETLMALADASRAEVKARSARRLVGGIVLLAALCIVTVFVAIHAFRQSRNAKIQSNEAHRQTRIAESKTAELNESQKLLAEINFARNLAATSLKYRQRNLGLALLLDLEAGRIADEIDPKTPVQKQAKDALIPDIRAALVGGLLFSPHLRTFLTGQSDVINSVAYSSDGKILATASFDGTIILWDARGFPLGPPLKGHNGGVYGVAFSPDGKTIASCGGDGIVDLWDLARLGTRRTFTVGPDALRQIAFAPDGKTLACGTEAGTVVLLDVAGRGEMVTLPGHTGNAYTVAFSPDGKTLASGGQDKKIVLWNLGSRKFLGSVEDDSEVYSVTFSPDGKTLAAGNRHKEVTLWDVAKRQRLGLPLKGHVNSVFSVAFSPDGKTLFSGSPDKTIRRWDVAKRTPIGDPLIGSGQGVYSVAVHPDGKTMSSGAKGGVAALWDLQSASVIAQPLGLGRESSVMAVTPDGETMAVADFEGNISVISPKVFETFNANVKKIWSLAFDADGTVLASVGDNNIIQVRTWNGKTWNTPSRLLAPPPQQFIYRIIFNPIDKRILVSGHEDGSILFWNIESGQTIAKPIKLVSSVRAFAWSPDGSKLAVGGQGEIALWDVAREQQLEPTLRGHYNSILALAFSPDAKLLASGGEDSDVILWNAETGQFVDLLREHTARVTGVAFSLDGKVLASCSNDKSIILWDVAAGTSIHLVVNEDNVFNVRFLPTGELVSGGADVIYWDISMESLRSRAEEVAARNLTEDEWARFMENRPYRPTSIYGSLKEADMLALQNNVEAARTAFLQVVVMAGKTKDANLNNSAGWYGCLDGFAEIVKPACDRAVQLARAEDKAEFQDSRGLANALTGKFSEAAEDFKAFVAWSRLEEERNSKTGADSRKMAVWKERREKREAWIPQLLSGHNPFDAETLKTLRIQDALVDE